MIAATGRKNNQHHQNNSAAKGVLHAIPLACRKWSHPFVVNTESGALKYYQGYKHNKACEFRWVEELQAKDSSQLPTRPIKFRLPDNAPKRGSSSLASSASKLGVGLAELAPVPGQ